VKSVFPKKRYGQHFLKNPDIAKRIVSLLEAEAGCPIVEIGPGKGALTHFLLSSYPQSPLYLYEPDSECIAYLKERVLPPYSNWELHQQSIIKVDLSRLGVSPVYCIGNLPYNMTGPILFWLLKHRHHIRRGVFMLQEEVVQRLTASSGTKRYGAISVLFQTYFRIVFHFSVASNQFDPPPKVESAVFSLEPNLPDPVPFDLLHKLVKQAFSHRRKMLKNNVRTFPIPPPLQSLRAEEIPISTYHEWIRSLNQSNP
jgi:16S rRNA (adenine1518-N6/adenine1519-N6)-dimethyltransferase